MMDNPLLRNISKNMLPVLKDHLETNLPVPAGNFAREEMVSILMSGKYPSAKIRKAYVEDLRNVPDDPGSHDDRARHNEIREHGKGEKVSHKLFSIFKRILQDVAISAAPGLLWWRRCSVSSSTIRSRS